MKAKLGLAILAVTTAALVSSAGIYQASPNNALKGIEVTKLNVQTWIKGSGVKPGSVTWPGVKVEWRYTKTSGYARIFNVKPIPFASLAPPNIVEPGWPFQVNRCAYERLEVSIELRGSGVKTVPAPVVLDGGKLIKSDPHPSGWEGNVPVYTVDLRGGKTPKITYVMVYSGSAGGAATSAPSSSAPGAGVSSAPPAEVSSAAGGSVASAKGGSVASAAPGSVAAAGAGAGAATAPTAKGSPSSAPKTAKTGVLGAGTYKTGVSIFALGAAVMAALLGGYLIYRGVG